MKASQQLHDLGQSLWLDNITRDLLDSGTLKRYIDELSVTGLTSNPTIFDNAISRSSWYGKENSFPPDSGRQGRRASHASFLFTRPAPPGEEHVSLPRH